MENKTKRTLLIAAAVVVALFVGLLAINGPNDGDDDTVVTDAPTTLESTVPPTTEASAAPSSVPEEAPRVAVAERLMDLYLEADQEALATTLGDADGAEGVLYSLGYRKGIGDVVVERSPCEAREGGLRVTCVLIFRSNFEEALGTDENVTESWEIWVEDGAITNVYVEPSFVPPATAAAVAWVNKNKPELRAGACKGMWFGGPTPEECGQAMVDAVREYAALEN